MLILLTANFCKMSTEADNIFNIPGSKPGLSVGFRVVGCAVVWVEVPISVVNAETPSVVPCTVVVDGSCVPVTADISAVVLLSSSVLEVLDTLSVVFSVVS